MRAIDLFCGTGGFSRGAHEAGFDVVGAYDLDPNLTFSYEENFPNSKLFLKDIAQLTGQEVLTDVGGGPIDLVFGGPPCQGFSLIGRRDKNDPRRSLLGHFFRIVSEIRPTVFVMENVQGLLLDGAKDELDSAIAKVTGYKILEPQILNAADFGAATNRRRAFVIGYDPNLCNALSVGDFDVMKCAPTTVAEAIAGLKAPASLGQDAQGFDHWRMRKNSKQSAYSIRSRDEEGEFTGNKRTKHLPRIVQRFSTIEQGGFDPIGKYPRLSSVGLCPTLRAGTGADKGSHQAVRPIHPEEDRVITVREAARLQGFPDIHKFHPTIWHSFRQIGNSVSPIISQAVLTIINEHLRKEELGIAAE